MPWQEGSIHKLQASVLIPEGGFVTIHSFYKLNRRLHMMSSADIFVFYKYFMFFLRFSRFCYITSSVDPSNLVVAFFSLGFFFFFETLN